MEKEPIATQSYDEWMDKIKKASNAKPIEELDKIENPVHPEILKEHATTMNVNTRMAVVSILVFLVSLTIRLFFILFLTNSQNAGAGWYNDSYHHWQIAYLTKEIGLGKDFLRLWDLIGMEYFWGLLQPLLLVVLYAVSGTADIMVSRIMNSVLGSLTAAVVFLLVKKRFNWNAAIASALLVVINPVGIFTDTSGMQEPLAILLMFLGIYFWPGIPALTGLCWLLASMARAEYWLFSLGLIAVILIFDKFGHKKVFVLSPYIVGILLYMKYLLDRTGNGIYPIYWNFFGNAAGEWQADIPLTGQQEAVRYVFLGILVIAVLASIYLILKRPRAYLFFLLGTGNLIFLSLFIGFTEYLKSYLPRFWVDRIFLLPYICLGVLLSVIVLYILPKYVKYVGKVIGWVIIFSSAIVMQFAWLEINFYRRSGDIYIAKQQGTARNIMSDYLGGSILIPGNDPILTYALYKEGLEGRDIRGEMFDPYFYFTDTDPYKNWGDNRKIVFNWLNREKIELIVYADEFNNRYARLVEKEPDKFIDLGSVAQYHVFRYKKNAVYND